MQTLTWPTESAGRWLEPCGNARPRGMTVIARKGRNRIPLTGLLHTEFIAAPTRRHFFIRVRFVSSAFPWRGRKSLAGLREPA